MTTSGRAALYQALLHLGAAAGRRVLVPSYHCPSMVAPVVHAGLVPQFYAIRADGSPDLEHLALDATDPPAAIIVAHYFGLPRSMLAVRAWCDNRGVVLIEDCAHCFFGHAGERPVGQWGDYSIASLTKFFALPEAGLLVSNRVPLSGASLKPAGFKAELKGAVDVLELASIHGRLRGLTTILRAVFAAKNFVRGTDPSKTSVEAATAADMDNCDMKRSSDEPLRVSQLLFGIQGRARIHRRRRENYSTYVAALSHLPGIRPLAPELPADAAPYVFPVLVDDAERIYHALRRGGMPVFRWDRVWPGAPGLPDDHAPVWHRHLLQLLCHQDLSPDDIAEVCGAVRQLLQEQSGNHDCHDFGRCVDAPLGAGP
jgi:dTDP-4-amino-4,6-dideoxygalactose transaminase